MGHGAGAGLCSATAISDPRAVSILSCALSGDHDR